MQTLQGFLFGLVGMGAMFAAFLTMVNSWRARGLVSVERDIEVEMPEPVSVMTTDNQLVKLRRIEI